VYNADNKFRTQIKAQFSFKLGYNFFFFRITEGYRWRHLREQIHKIKGVVNYFYFVGFYLIHYDDKTKGFTSSSMTNETIDSFNIYISADYVINIMLIHRIWAQAVGDTIWQQKSRIDQLSSNCNSWWWHVFPK
jgi:hypothetical protein